MERKSKKSLSKFKYRQRILVRVPVIIARILCYRFREHLDRRKYKSFLLIISLFLSSHGLKAQEIDGLNVPITSHYFGTFVRDKGMKTYTFELENTGNDPLVISRVKSTCGCTVAEWTKAPIPPGEKGKVKVQFDPKKFSGYFSKRVSVYTNRSASAINLQISGRILVNNKVNDDFVYFLGDLKADKDEINFGEVEINSAIQVQEIRLINVMRDTIWLTPKKLPKGFSYEQSEEVIPPGGSCRLTLRYDPSGLTSWGSLNSSIALEIKRAIKTEVRKVPVSLSLIDAFSQLSQEQIDYAPSIACLDNIDKIIMNGKLNQWETTKLTLINNGRSDLLIRKIETNSSNIIVKKYDEKIASGKTGRVLISFLKTTDMKKLEQELVIWNNSPENYLFRVLTEIK